MPKRIDAPDYWISDFKPTSKDLDALYGYALDVAQPMEIEQLAAALVRQHVERLTAVHRSRAAASVAVYIPSDRYETGQKLVFPALDGAAGKVGAVRQGNNPAYGAYEVIRVDLDGVAREFAAGIAWEHALSETAVIVDPDVLSEQFAPLVAPRLTEELQADKEWSSFGNRWVLRAMLPKVNAGHRNLAEAVIMLAGEAMPTERVVAEIELDPAAPLELRKIALDIALHGDNRFRNVGAHESPLWALKPS